MSKPYATLPPEARKARNRAIIKLASTGLKPAQIAEHLSIERYIVWVVLGTERRKIGHTIPNSRGHTTTIEIPNDALDRLIEPAAKRRVTPRLLASMIVVTAVRAGLIDAVLDDAS